MHNFLISNDQARQTDEGLNNSGNDETDVDLADGEDGEAALGDGENGEEVDRAHQTGNPHILRRVCARRSTRVFLRQESRELPSHPRTSQVRGDRLANFFSSLREASPLQNG